MSDRTNRDVGRKRQYKQTKNLCGCWWCTSGKEKKHILTERLMRRTKHVKMID